MPQPESTAALCPVCAGPFSSQQPDLFGLPPSRPDREPMTEEQIEAWMADLPF
jgi:hypothetical protein